MNSSWNNKKIIEKVKENGFYIFENCFDENIKYNEIPEWDSIGHMTLISGLEEGFNISMETDDIVDFSSFKKGIEILKKYSISF